MSNTVPTKITDKNGKLTTVHKKVDDGSAATGRFASAPVAISFIDSTATRVNLAPGQETEYGSDCGIGYNEPITRLDLYRSDVDEEKANYTLTAYSQYFRFAEMLPDHAPELEAAIAEKGEDGAQDYLNKHGDHIEAFFKRDYDIDEMDWTDDLEGQAVVYREWEEAPTEDEVLAITDDNNFIAMYNESDPGTFGTRNMYAALGAELNAFDEVSEMSGLELSELADEKRNYVGKELSLRAIAFDERVTGKDVEPRNGSTVVLHRAVVSNPHSPADAIEHIANFSPDESVQILAVETDMMGGRALKALYDSTPYQSVRDSINAGVSNTIMAGFGS